MTSCRSLAYLAESARLRAAAVIVFSLEVSEFLLRSQQEFRQFAAFLLVEITTEFALVGMMFELAVALRHGARTVPLARQQPHLSSSVSEESAYATEALVAELSSRLSAP